MAGLNFGSIRIVQSFSVSKGGLNGSSLAKAGEFAATDLNNSDLPYFFTHSSGRT